MNLIRIQNDDKQMPTQTQWLEDIEQLRHELMVRLERDPFQLSDEDKAMQESPEGQQFLEGASVGGLKQLCIIHPGEIVQCSEGLVKSEEHAIELLLAFGAIKIDKCFDRSRYLFRCFAEHLDFLDYVLKHPEFQELCLCKDEDGHTQQPAFIPSSIREGGAVHMFKVGSVADRNFRSDLLDFQTNVGHNYLQAADDAGPESPLRTAWNVHKEAVGKNAIDATFSNQ